jgi:hypothetical protein
MRAAALTLSLSLLAGGCFPDNARHRTIAKIVEGGVTVGGIALLAVVNSGADCMTDVPGTVDQSCEDNARVLSTTGLGMILTGLIGFIVTVSTAEEDKPKTSISTTPTPAPISTAPTTAPAAPATTTPPSDTPPTTPPETPETPAPTP